MICCLLFSVQMEAPPAASPEVANMEVEAEGEMRLCKHCQKKLPLRMFLKGPCRFVCKAHMREIVRKGSTPPSQYEIAARKIWTTAYKDVKCVFGKTDSISLTHRNIRSILERADQPPTRYRDVFILPLVPMEPLTGDNALLSGRSTLKYLMTLWRTKRDPGAYANAVQQLGANSLL